MSTDWSRWLGRAQVESDDVVASRVAAWNATLDRRVGFPANGDEAPAGFHWTLFPPLAPASELGADGHARTGSFLPAVPLPRRMWAGSRVSFLAPLRVGDAVERRSEIASITEKDSRSGPLIFVTVRHTISVGGAEAIVEEQDLVYREAAAPSAPRPPSSASAPAGTWRRTVHPTSTLLFRYSALTFNGHRIHYDLPYAREVEGYPGLVVHGPLIATLLLLLLGDHHSRGSVTRFHFKALRPTFDTAAFELHGTPDADGRVRLWSTNAEQEMAVEAHAWTA